MSQDPKRKSLRMQKEGVGCRTHVHLQCCMSWLPFLGSQSSRALHVPPLSLPPLIICLLVTCDACFPLYIDFHGRDRHLLALVAFLFDFLFSFLTVLQISGHFWLALPPMGLNLQSKKGKFEI